MKLPFKQLKNLTFGAAYVEERDEKTIFHRFNQQEEELYKAVGYKFYKKTLANSCITIEFQTNSASLFLKTCVTPRSSRNFYSHDVYVDGVFCDSLKGIVDLPDDDSIKSEIVEKNFVLGENGKLKNIRIHLPWSCSSDIIELSIDDGATVFSTDKDINKKTKILLYGDSITQGYDADYTSNSYASRLMLNLNAEARNKGIGGEVFRPELTEIKNEDFEPDIITVAYGTNDWSGGISKEVFESKINDFFAYVAKNYPNAKIFAIAPIWRADYLEDRPFGKFKDLKKCLSNVANKYSNITLIDGFDFVPHDCNLFSDKSLHPNDEGFAYYANSLLKEMQKHLN